MENLQNVLLRNDIRSSKIGKQLAAGALGNPGLLAEIIPYLKNKDKKAKVAVAETFAEVAKQNPKLILPHLNELYAGLEFPEPQTRWETIVALTAIATISPASIKNTEKIACQINEPKSMIVRGATARFLGFWGMDNKKRREKALSYLLEGLEKHGFGNEGGEIIKAIVKLANQSSDHQLKTEIIEILRPYLDRTNKTAAKAIANYIENCSKLENSKP